MAPRKPVERSLVPPAEELAPAAFPGEPMVAGPVASVEEAVQVTQMQAILTWATRIRALGRRRRRPPA